MTLEFYIAILIIILLAKVIFTLSQKLAGVFVFLAVLLILINIFLINDPLNFIKDGLAAGPNGLEDSAKAWYENFSIKESFNAAIEKMKAIDWEQVKDNVLNILSPIKNFFVSIFGEATV